MYIKILIAILLFSSLSFSQTKTERIIYTELAVVSYGVIDYVLYNSLKKSSVENYRFLQGIIFSGINYFLYKTFGYKSAISFSLQSLFAVPDGVYYGIDGISRGFGGFSYGNEYHSTDNYKHLNFMPTVWGSKNIRKSDVITNIILGMAIGITINF